MDNFGNFNGPLSSPDWNCRCDVLSATLFAIGVKRLFLLSCNFCSFGKNTHVEVWLCLWRVCIWIMWPPIFKLEQAFVRDPHKVMTTLILDVLCLVWPEFTLQLPFSLELFQHFHRCGASIHIRLLYHSHWQLDAWSSPQHWHTSHMVYDCILYGFWHWSLWWQGMTERAQCYAPILQELQRCFPHRSQERWVTRKARSFSLMAFPSLLEHSYVCYAF